MSYTLGQAARATGKAKPTIARAIQTGRITASRGDDGSWQIEPVELHRVYPMTQQTNGQMLRDLPGLAGGVSARPSGGEPTGTSLTELLAERDRLVTEQAETIRDLRGRLDAEAEERRKLTALLTGPQRSWWRRWRR